MSKKQINQLEIIRQVESRKLTQKFGSELLSLSSRQLRRKQKRYRRDGINGLQHKSIGKSGNNRIPQKVVAKIITLAMGKYIGYGPTLMRERLSEQHNIKIGYETLRRLLIKYNLWTVKKKGKIKHVWRERKHCEGELIQADGSRHLWFGGENYIDLLGLIDDATGKIYIKFARENTVDFSTFFKEFVEENGVPQAFYCDRGKVFKVNNVKYKLDAKTQFERMLSELDVNVIHASSPQAKGRIERLFKTLQDRLLKELKENNICDVDSANAYLKKSNFIEKFNDRFSVQAISDTVVYKSVEHFDLNSIFCKKYYRKINNDYTVQFKQNWYQLLKKQPVKLKTGMAIEIRLQFDNTIGIFSNGHKLNCQPIEKRKEKPAKTKVYNNRTSANS